MGSRSWPALFVVASLIACEVCASGQKPDGVRVVVSAAGDIIQDHDLFDSSSLLQIKAPTHCECCGNKIPSLGGHCPSCQCAGPPPKSLCECCGKTFEVEADHCPDCSCAPKPKLLCECCGDTLEIEADHCPLCGCRPEPKSLCECCGKTFEVEADRCPECSCAPKPKLLCECCGKMFDTEADHCPICQCGDRNCHISGGTLTWCEETKGCTKPSKCPSYDGDCTPDAHGCITCDGEVPCGSSCQHASIPCHELSPQDGDQWEDHHGPSYIGVNIKNEARCGTKRIKLASNSNSEDCAALASGAQEANDLERPVLAYSLGQKAGVNIGDCWAELDVGDTLVASWQKCKDNRLAPCANPECPLGDGWLKDPMFDFFYLEEELEEKKADPIPVAFR